MPAVQRSRLLVLIALACFGQLAACGSEDDPTGPGSDVGSIAVQVTTTGDSGAIDRDGYSVTAGGASGTVPANGTATLSGVSAGQVTVTLGGVEANCTPTSTSVSVTVSTGSAASAAFEVDCATLPGIPRWYSNIGGELRGVSLGPDGRIYAPSSSSVGRLFALDASGAQAWNFTADDAVSGPPAVHSDGTLFFGSIVGTAYALNPDGSEKWSTTLGGAFGVSGTPAIASDGTQYWTDDNFLDAPTLTALNSSGGVVWTYQDGGQGAFTDPVVAGDGTIYIGRNEGASGTFVALNASGGEKWTYTTVGPPTAAAIASGGTVYFGGGASFDGANLTVDGNVYALNPNGSEAWKFPTGGLIEHAPAIGSDGTIYVISGSSNPDADPDVGTLHALNTDGTEQWSATLDGCAGGGPSVGVDGVVHAPVLGCRFGGSGQVEAFDASGNPLWVFQVTGEFKGVRGSIPIASDGTAYAASELTGEVYAIRTESMGLAASAWPKPGHDNQNSGNSSGGS